MTTGQVESPSSSVAERPGRDLHGSGAPARAWVAERLFRNAVRTLPVRVLMPGNRTLGAGRADSPLMRIERPATFFRRLGTAGKIGFGEAYQAGDWSADDLVGVLTPLAANVRALVPRPLQRLRRWVEPRKPTTEDNDLEHAKAHIEYHYDLSNDLFATFLDESMTYSSAVFGPGDDLHAAQLRKIDAILDAAAVGPGTRLCEIGTGWGSLAIRAAERGAEVTTLTISSEQRDLAQRRVAEAGQSNRVDVQLRDYRQAEGRFDAVVSIEMIEAVGEAYWADFFTTVHRLLVPGGTASLQAITMPHDRMLATRHSYTWIHKYIFPGGHLPSLPAIAGHARRAGLHIAGQRDLTDHYAHTLAQWRQHFTDAASAGTIAALEPRFDETFRRTWEFYLAYSEAGFASEYLNLRQIRLTKPFEAPRPPLSNHGHFGSRGGGDRRA